uniref:Poly(rC) binding protein 3 n=1 Tax=Sinocyclocheilus grahami TaxID=75366 RepID=A0A672M0G8_SINGR
MELNKVQSEGGLNVTLTIRLLMHGKKGETVKKMREESGARINISEGNCPERIVTITGPTDAIFKAFAMIAYKFEEVLLRTVKCSREEMGLQHRFKTLNGVIGFNMYREAVSKTHANSPPKGATIPYRPKPASTPVIFSGGQVRADPLAASAANLSLLLQHQPLSTVPPNPQQLTKLHQLAMQQTPFTPLGQTTPAFPGLDASPPASTHELTIPNDLIGCIIGRQGTKINEIRQMSGAQIKIANAMEGSSERQITITGTPANISLAQYLINARFRDVAAMWNDPSSMTTS